MDSHISIKNASKLLELEPTLLTKMLANNNIDVYTVPNFYGFKHWFSISPNNKITKAGMKTIIANNWKPNPEPEPERVYDEFGNRLYNHTGEYYGVNSIRVYAYATTTECFIYYKDWYTFLKKCKKLTKGWSKAPTTLINIPYRHRKKPIK